MIGQIISHYKILEKLGEGGMGIVYKAHDTKLDRDVALKFLPQQITLSEEEKARFLQEARAASAVTHPNVCVIHDIAEFDGQQFIVMEYVDGKTLRHLVPVKKIHDAISLAIQTAEALQEAHSKSVVHRDIKTDNIMVTSKNQVKVMDFGLAKLKGSLKVTRTSSTVGTLGYMAPEQIQGGEVDARSDIFSFGVVMYEMLAGHLPFRGEHEAAIVYSIANEEPEPIQKYRQEVSPEFIHILNRALEKDPDDRYQTMNEVLIELRRLKRETTRVTRPSIDQISLTRLPRKGIVFAGALLLIITAAIVILMLQRGGREPSGPMVTRMLKIPSSNVNFPNISSDGNWIVFVAADTKRIPNLHIVHASGGEPKKITTDTMYVEKQMPCFSPDASQIIYERWESTPKFQQDIHIVAALGGTSRRLISNATLPMWSPDGKRIAFFRPAGRTLELWTANSDGSGETRIASLTPVFFYNVAWSPDSKRLAFLRSFQTPVKERYTEIFVRELEDSSEHQITFDKKIIDDFCWPSTEEIVFNSNRGGDVDLWVIPEGGGTPKQLTLGAGADRVPRVSKDAKHLVYVNESETSNLWTLDLQTKQLQQLTFDDARISQPVHSWDGTKLFYWRYDMFESSRTGYVVSSKDGGDATRTMPTIEDYTVTSMAPGRWSAEGKSVILTAVRGDTVRKNPDSVVVHSSFFEHELGTNVTRKIADGTLFDISRDWKYVLYRRDQDSIFWRGVLALRATPGKAIREIISPSGPPHFSWDSKDVISQDSVGIWFTPVEEAKNPLLVKAPKNFWFALPSPDGKTLLGGVWDPIARITTVTRFFPSKGTIEEITGLPPAAGIWGWTSSISPDGRTLVFSRLETKNRIVLLDNFR